MLHVLIVENEDVDLVQIQNAVREECGPNCHITVARSEDEAFRTIDNRQSFDLAVVDLCLSDPPKPYPDEEGFVVISRLHKAQPDCRIIAKTTRLALSDARRATAVGASDVVSSKWEKLEYSDLLRQRISFWNRMIVPSEAPLPS